MKKKNTTKEITKKIKEGNMKYRKRKKNEKSQKIEERKTKKQKLTKKER